jgi:hypothetical protein
MQPALQGRLRSPLALLRTERLSVLLSLGAGFPAGKP